jgi:excisionase family DNA binding protein
VPPDPDLSLRELIRQVLREELAKLQPTQPTPQLLTVADAARYARVKPDTIRSWIKAGRLPATRLGGHAREAHRVGDRVVPAMVGGRLRITPADLELAINRPKRAPRAPSKLSPEEQGKRAAEQYAARNRVATSK